MSAATQAGDAPKPPPSSYQHAACLLAAQALVPSPAAAAGGLQTQVALTVQRPRVILVRRFMNNVLYVMALVSHEVDAAGSPQQPGRGTQAAGPPPQAMQQQQQQKTVPGVPTAALLLTLTSVQVRECMHACSRVEGFVMELLLC